VDVERLMGIRLTPPRPDFPAQIKTPRTSRLSSISSYASLLLVFCPVCSAAPPAGPFPAVILHSSLNLALPAVILHPS
jgi:hypothetical protein